ncbi:MAG: glycosyltransferase [Candidatus Lokiarchaeia archaeon]|nr:glycosyltransferase [Candidatus Lokiarchaeia archaeon]
MSEKIAGVVIIFNPNPDVLGNIESYLHQVDLLFLFDNSEVETQYIIKFAKENKKIEYLFNGKNLGIGEPINKAADLSIENGFKYLLTMDQDSNAQYNLVREQLRIFDLFQNIAIVSPWIIDKNYPVKSNAYVPYEVDYCITSGCLLNLKAFQKVGGYNEKLFIDYLDFDLCFRIRESNYKIIKNPQVNIFHSVGQLKNWKIGPFNFFSTNHPPLRLYYRTRNRLYIRKIYRNQKKFFRKDIIKIVKEIVKIILVEVNKLEKLKMIVLGYRDFRKNKLGKFERKI